MDYDYLTVDDRRRYLEERARSLELEHYSNSIALKVARANGEPEEPFVRALGVLETAIRTVREELNGLL